MTPQAGDRSGFTLLEVLIALTILSIAATGLIGGISQSIRQTEWLETKTIAGWIAQNSLSEIRALHAWPGLGAQTETLSMAERQWQVRVAVAATAHADMRRIDVSVSTEQAPVLSLTGFIGKY